MNEERFNLISGRAVIRNRERFHPISRKGEWRYKLKPGIVFLIFSGCCLTYLYIYVLKNNDINPQYFNLTTQQPHSSLKIEWVFTTNSVESATSDFTHINESTEFLHSTSSDNEFINNTTKQSDSTESEKESTTVEFSKPTHSPVPQIILSTIVTTMKSPKTTVPSNQPTTVPNLLTLSTTKQTEMTPATETSTTDGIQNRTNPPDYPTTESTLATSTKLLKTTPTTSTTSIERTTSTQAPSTQIAHNLPSSATQSSPTLKGLLVSSRECHIPDLDPFAPTLRMNFKKTKLLNCKATPPLTDVAFDEHTRRSTLIFHSNLTTKYSQDPLSCCYSEIKRSGTGSRADKSFKLLKCLSFNATIQLPLNINSILVTCTAKNKKAVYKNMHVLIPQSQSLKSSLDQWKSKDSNDSQPFNVILFGIDSISRMNLIRTMPKTYKHLLDSGWFEMAGYNKMGDNTFPNLMAVLSGYNVTTVKNKCQPTKVGGLDNCSIVWKDYEKAGYVTAYAEDELEMSTFDYLKPGFLHPPTACYLRPEHLAAEKHLKIQKLWGLKFCIGYKLAAEYVYDYIFEMRQAYKNYPKFGLFWTNSFSHNAYSAPATMDEKVLGYLRSMHSTGVLNDSIVIFFSDHGMRFGPLRRSATGHLEERLPMLYFSIPPALQQRHPEFVEALKINKNRLTTPYDLHITLKHILELSGRKKVSRSALDCPNCQSLFEPVPLNRSCEDVAIEDHWCTCRAFHPSDKNSKMAKQIVQQTIDYMNDLVKHAENGSVAHLCQKLVLKKILFLNQEVLPHEPSNTTIRGYQMSFETNPGAALFETTVRIDIATNKFTVTGSVSRLNEYAKQAKCINVAAVKKYCACKR